MVVERQEQSLARDPKETPTMTETTPTLRVTEQPHALRPTWTIEHYGTRREFLAFIQAADPCVLDQATAQATDGEHWRIVGNWPTEQSATDWARAITGKGDMGGFFDMDADIEQAQLEAQAAAIARCKHEYRYSVPDDYPDWLRQPGYSRCDDCGCIIDADGVAV